MDSFVSELDHSDAFSCDSILDGENVKIDPTAMCKADVTFKLNTHIAEEVSIGVGCSFGPGLHVGKRVEMDNFIEAGPNVRIEKYACLEGAVFLPADTIIKKFHKVVRVSNDCEFIQKLPSKGKMFEMEMGKCTEVDV